MRVCVTAVAPSLDAQIDPRFGRCAYFIIVDTDTMSFKAIPNTSASALSGAGIQAAQTVVNEGVEAVITGNVGPNSYQVLASAGVKIFTGAFGTVREAIEAYKAGRLREAFAPGFGPGFGMGRGMGRGMGMGMGRGMGFGRGMGWTPPSPPPTPPPSPNKEQEIMMLENQMRILQQQLEEIKRRLKELRGE